MAENPTVSPQDPEWWTVGGRVVGSKLPDQLEIIPDVAAVFRVADEHLDRFRDTRARPEHPRIDSGTMMSVLPSHRLLTGPHVVYLRVFASSADEAEEKARAELLPPVLLALNAVAPGSQIEPIHIVRDADGTGVSVWSQGAGFTAFDPRPLSADEEDSVRAVAQLVHKDDFLRSLSRQYSEALVLAYGPADRTHARSAVLELFKVIEGVADKVATVTRRADPEGLRKAQAQVVARCVEDIGEASDDEAHVTILRTAAKELTRLEYGYADEKVRLAGGVLEVAQHRIDTAVAVAKARNSEGIAHFRTNPVLVERWLAQGPDDLRAAALSYAMRYVQEFGQLHARG